MKNIYLKKAISCKKNTLYICKTGVNKMETPQEMANIKSKRA